MPKSTKDYSEFIKSHLNLTKNNNIKENPKKLINLLYNNYNFDFANEKRVLINEFFSDLFIEDLKWKITNSKNQDNKPVTKIFLKYLEKTEFNLKTWIVHYRAGFNGKYGLLINKEEKNDVDDDGYKLTEPILVPVQINYENKRNDQLIQVYISYDNNLIYGKSIYTLNEVLSIFDNKLKITRDIWDIKNDKQIPQKKYSKNFNLETINNLKLEKEESINQKFLPIEIFKVNSKGTPRTSKIDNKLVVLAAFDESVAILPFWERGGIMRNGKDVLPTNVSEQNFNFMSQLLLDGFSDIKPNSADQYQHSLQEEIVTWQPRSVMQTMRNTRNDIWDEIKEDLGIPSIDEIKSAQKSELEIKAKQFLTSPQIEREKMLFLNFLKNFGKKFLMFLNECNIIEKNDLKEYDFSKWNVSVEIDLMTDKNINSTIEMMSKIDKKKEVTDNGTKSE